MVLEKILKPNDIKKIPQGELNTLAQEIRDFIMEKVSANGGHLASNLGTVELTIALHLCMDFPTDKLIWDVGHQTYTHKVLTGRKDDFDSLRKLGGLSGFPKHEESDCDSFDTGHSSTSLSAGLGYVCARELKGENYKVVSVIGDGSLTGGLAYEALNNVSMLHSNFTMILNDNEMSISENVGGLAKYLSGLRTTKGYNNLKDNISASLNRIPGIGENMVRNISRTKSALKQAIIGGMFFEDMGITYLGPVDGHDIPTLVRVIKDAQRLDRAVIVHVITRKGKGYEPAMLHPELYHGVAPFTIEDGKPKSPHEQATYTDIFSKTVCSLAQKYPEIVAITAAMKEGTGLKAFAKRYPKRFFDVGIAEAHAVTFAAGLAAGGFHPFFAVYSSFLQRGYDEILHDVCIQKLPVTFAIDRAGLVGSDGETHQGVFDISYLTSIPNVAVMAPKNRYEFVQMLEFCASYNGPSAVRYPKTVAVKCLSEYRTPIEYGRSEWIIKGKDIAILALGTMVETAVEVEELLARDGYQPSVVNLRFAKPVDVKMLDDVMDSHRLVFTLEENVVAGGVGEHICSYIQSKSSHIRSIPFGIPDSFVKQGSISELKKLLKLDARGIYERICEYL